MRRSGSLGTRVLSIVLSALLIAATAPVTALRATDKPMLTLSDAVPESQGPVPERVSGGDRFATALEVSRKGWPDGSSEYVLLTTGGDWADALVANPLAASLGAPILPTASSGLLPPIWSEIQRLGATKAIILGGEKALSGKVVEDLVAAGFPEDGIERIGGSDRYETAVAVSKRVASIRGTSEKAIVATGESYADALSVASYAARNGYPVLLTRRNSLPKATLAELRRLGVSTVLVVGGESAVSAEVLTGLPKPNRVGGANRYDTARQVAEYSFSDGMTYDNVVVTTGGKFADALAAGPWVAKMGGMLILTNPSGLSPEASQFLNSHSTSIKAIFVVGGTTAVSDDALGAMQTAAETKMNSDELQIASPAAQAALETITPDWTLTFDNTVDPSSVEVNKVLVGTPADAAPEGYLRRVVSVTEVEGKVVVETSEATLADVILKGSIDVTGAVPAEQPAPPSSALTMSGARATSESTVEVDFDTMLMQGSRIDPQVRLGSASLAFNRTLYEKNNLSVRAEGNVDLGADFTLNASFGIINWHKAWWGWYPEYGLKEVRAVTSLSESMSLKILSELTLPGFEKEIELGKIRLPNVTVWAGAVPIVFVNTVTPVVGVSANLGANLEVGIGQWAGLSLGVEWTHTGGWKPIKSFSSGFSFDVEGAVEASAKAWVGARLDVQLYGVAGPFFQPQGFLEYKANTSQNPWWTLDGGVEAKFGGAIDVLGKKSSFDWTYELYRRRLINAPGAFPSMKESAMSGSVLPGGDAWGAGLAAIPAQKTMPSIYEQPAIETADSSAFTIPGLSVTAAEVVDADTVKLTTSKQGPRQEYAVSVAAGGVTASDGAKTVASTKAFSGHASITVVSSRATSGTTAEVVFDAGGILDPASVSPGDFISIGLSVLDAVVQPDGNTVLLTTSEQNTLERYRVLVQAGTIQDKMGWKNVSGESGFLGYWNLVDIATGPAGLALDSQGQLWAWGSNSMGQLGDGTTYDHTADPVRVEINKVGFRDIETTRRAMFAVDSDGDLWAWGGNEFGQLGVGYTIPEPGGLAMPTEVGAGIDWVDVEGGWYATYGLDASGNVYSWGSDNAGGLGNGPAGDQLVPMLVGTGYRQISAGKNHFVGIKTDGTLWGWGHNTVGELNGTPSMQQTAVQMSALTDWIDVSAGAYNTLALRSNGVVYYGGDNTGGTSGQGHTTYGAISFPTAVPGITDAVEVESSQRTIVVKRADGTLWTWGSGDGDSVAVPDSGTPRLRDASNDWTRLCADVYGGLAGIKADGSGVRFPARYDGELVYQFSGFKYVPRIAAVFGVDAYHADVIFDTATGKLDESTVQASDFLGSLVAYDAVVTGPYTVRIGTSEIFPAYPQSLEIAGGAISDSAGSLNSGIRYSWMAN